jgi:hypothetical protein
MMLVVTSVFGLLALWFASLAATPGNLSDILQKVAMSVVEVTSAALVGLAIFGYWKVGPGAHSVSIVDDGIIFHRSGGREDFFRWVGTADELIPLDCSSNGALAQSTKFP